MSVFGHEKYLKEAVLSILQQTYQDFEFLIVNDGNDAANRELLKSFADPRLIIIDQEWRGLTRSLNHAIGRSRGEYIARMDADDVSLPERFQKQVEVLYENPTVGLVGTSYMDISENGERIIETLFSQSSQELKQDLIFQNQFCHGSVMFRRKCCQKVGAYREEFRKAQDYDLWLRVAEHYDLSNLREVFYKRRVNVDSISIASKDEQNFFARCARECAKARRAGRVEPLAKLHGPYKPARGFKRLCRNDKKLSLFHYKLYYGRSLFTRRDLKHARQFFIAALRQLPYRLDLVGFLLATYLPVHFVNKIATTWSKLRRKAMMTA
ncbi:MAG: glycosyltransferase [bacterium]